MRARRVGMIGIGLMGTAFSQRLIAAGYDVVGFDPDPVRMKEHEARGGTPAISPAAAAAIAPVAILSLPNNAVGTQVCFGEDGIVSSRNSDLLVLDTTTGHPAVAVELAEGLGEVGIRFMDATMSGNSIQAANGDLVAMLGGSDVDAAAAADVLSVLSRSVHHVGPVGAGSQAKLIVNLVLGVSRTVLAEGLVMGEKSGLDLSKVLAVLKDSAAYSKAMDIWGERMIDGDFFPPGSRAKQSHKDARVITTYGREIGSPTMLSSVVQQLLQFAEMGGLGDADNASAIEVQRRLAGIGRIPMATLTDSER